MYMYLSIFTDYKRSSEEVYDELTSMRGGSLRSNDS